MREAAGRVSGAIRALTVYSPCIFPAPGRAPRRPRKPPDGELLARLRRLEGVVQSLGVQVDDEPPVQDGDKNGVNGATVKHEQGVDTQVIGDTKTDSLNESFGRLVIDEKGRSRYVNNRFWAALSNEVYTICGVQRTSC